jgi:hypothetical protein
LTGSESLYCTQPVGSKTSHFEKMSPSVKFSLTSPAPAFSPLAVTSTTLSVTLPGMPVALGPVTPDALSPSTVSVQVSCGSPASKEDEKFCDAAPAAEVAAAASVPVTITTATVARRKVCESRLGERLLDSLLIEASPRKLDSWT